MYEKCLGPELPRALYGPRMASLPENRLLITGGKFSLWVRNEVGGGNGSSGTHLDLFLKVYELSLPGADSWVFVSETQNSTYKLTIFELLKTWRK